MPNNWRPPLIAHSSLKLVKPPSPELCLTLPCLSCGKHHSSLCLCFPFPSSASWLTLEPSHRALHGMMCPSFWRIISNKLFFERQLSPCLSLYHTWLTENILAIISVVLSLDFSQKYCYCLYSISYCIKYSCCFLFLYWLTCSYMRETLMKNVSVVQGCNP